MSRMISKFVSLSLFMTIANLKLIVITSMQLNIIRVIRSFN